MGIHGHPFTMIKPLSPSNKWLPLPIVDGAPVFKPLPTVRCWCAGREGDMLFQIFRQRPLKQQVLPVKRNVTPHVDVAIVTGRTLTGFTYQRGIPNKHPSPWMNSRLALSTNAPSCSLPLVEQELIQVQLMMICHWLTITNVPHILSDHIKTILKYHFFTWKHICCPLRNVHCGTILAYEVNHQLVDLRGPPCRPALLAASGDPSGRQA